MSFGYIYAPDDRNRAYPMDRVLRAQPEPSEPVPNERIYATGPVLNQGPTSQCVGYTFAQWLISEPVLTLDGIPPEIIYQEAQARDGIPGPHEGTTLRAALQYLQDQGRIASYVWAFDVPTIRDWVLRNQGTVILGTPWHTGMNEPDRDGVIRAEGSVIEGHAWLLTGYNQERGLFRLVNSWGHGWGQFGQAWLPGEDLAKLLPHGEACCGVEQPVAPVDGLD
jgi:hypothetical protein